MTASFPIDDPSIGRAQHVRFIQDPPDIEHSLHVAWLSLRLYDQLRDVLALPGEGRDLLAAAALWHDVGQHHSMDDHHRYSFNLIMARPLQGFTQEEQLQIANIARYHRRAHPSVEHPGYRNLPRRLRPTVDKMAALLRLAEGLDAGHLQVVQDLTCEPHAAFVRVVVFATQYPMLEVERAQERARLFRDTFHKDLDIVPELRRRSRSESGSGIETGKDENT